MARSLVKTGPRAGNAITVARGDLGGTRDARQPVLYYRRSLMGREKMLDYGALSRTPIESVRAVENQAARRNNAILHHRVRGYEDVRSYRRPAQHLRAWEQYDTSTNGGPITVKIAAHTTAVVSNEIIAISSAAKHSSKWVHEPQVFRQFDFIPKLHSILGPVAPIKLVRRSQIATVERRTGVTVQRHRLFVEVKLHGH